MLEKKPSIDFEKALLKWAFFYDPQVRKFLKNCRIFLLRKGRQE